MHSRKKTNSPTAPINMEITLGCQEIRESFDINTAITAQKIIANKIKFEDRIRPSDIKMIVSLDASYWKNSTEKGVGVAVALSYPELEMVDCFVTIRKVCVPYIPGLLAFREMYLLTPSLINLWKNVKPDVVFVDGHGYAHPRFAGLATHIGVVFNIPTIGIAKKRLVGQEVQRGSEYILAYKDRIVGKILPLNNKKFYISVGSNITLDESVEIVKRTVKGKHIVPNSIADKISKNMRKKYSIVKLDDILIEECKKDLLEKI